MLADYIIKTQSTVRSAAKKFNVSKSTVHTVVLKRNDSLSDKHDKIDLIIEKAL